MTLPEVQFPCHIILVEHWNSPYVVLTIKCVLILFIHTVWNTVYTQLERVHYTKYCLYKIYSSIIQFSEANISSNASVLNIFGTGFEGPTVVRIHNVVWVRLVYSLVHGSECFGRSDSRSRPNHLCPPISLQGPITQKTTISNLNVCHFSCIISHYKCLNYTYLAINIHYCFTSYFAWAEICQRKCNEKC